MAQTPLSPTESLVIGRDYLFLKLRIRLPESLENIRGLEAQRVGIFG